MMEMTYEEFNEQITARVRDRFGDAYTCRIVRIPKNNGIVRTGLSISRRNSHMAPIVYLDDHFVHYRQGRSLDSLADEIMEIYRKNDAISETGFSALRDLSIRDKVVCCLVHSFSNRELLADIPSVPYLDLSIVFYLQLSQCAYGQMTMKIHNRHLKMWGITVEELYRLALDNTPRLLPPVFETMEQVLKEMAGGVLNEGHGDALFRDILPKEDPMYILSNRTGINGAAAILYPGVLMRVSELLQQRDLVILPSSVHEVIIVPYDERIDLEAMSDMVVTVNREQVCPEDRLSNHVYLYSQEEDKVRCTTEYPLGCVA